MLGLYLGKVNIIGKHKVFVCTCCGVDFFLHFKEIGSIGNPVRIGSCTASLFLAYKRTALGYDRGCGNCAALLRNSRGSGFCGGRDYSCRAGSCTVIYGKRCGNTG